MWSKLDIFLRHSTDREVALMMLMAYLSYMLAEVKFYDVLYHLHNLGMETFSFILLMLFCLVCSYSP